MAEGVSTNRRTEVTLLSNDDLTVGDNVCVQIRYEILDFSFRELAAKDAKFELFCVEFF